MIKTNKSLNYKLLRSALVTEINRYEGFYDKWGSHHQLNILDALYTELAKVRKLERTV